MRTKLNFGQAVEALKAGKRVAREGWTGVGLFVFMQVPANIPAAVVPAMQSLPPGVKEEFEKREPIGLKYKNQLALVKPDNEINGWAPSVADALAEDWMVLDKEPGDDRPPHQQRVIEERDELADRTQKLGVFIDVNKLFKSLPEDEQQRLCRQQTLMLEYWKVLEQRIAAFPA